MMMMIIITMMIMMIMMMMLVIPIMLIIVIVFLERLSMSSMLNCAEQVQVQNIKHTHIRHPEQPVFKQSC